MSPPGLLTNTMSNCPTHKYHRKLWTRQRGGKAWSDDVVRNSWAVAVGVALGGGRHAESQEAHNHIDQNSAVKRHETSENDALSGQEK
jgi:hypothetical protein